MASATLVTNVDMRQQQMVILRGTKELDMKVSDIPAVSVDMKQHSQVV